MLKKKWAYVALSFEDAQRYHRHLWRWMARNPGAMKEEWPGWLRFDMNVVNECFACYIARAVLATTSDTRVFCICCPVTKWREEFNPEPYTLAACQANEYGEFLRGCEYKSKPNIIEACKSIAEIKWEKDKVASYPQTIREDRIWKN